MGHGFDCLACGRMETAHGFPDVYRTCGRYTSPCPEEERRLFAQDAEAAARERRAGLRLVEGDAQ